MKKRFKTKIATVLNGQIQKEIPVIEWIQEYRHPILDSFFLVAGLLGTHQFYLLSLPALFWFNTKQKVYYDEQHVEDMGRLFCRGIILILAFGCYLTGFIKDWLELPRPHSAKIKQIVEHHETTLEYGFPSTHAAHAMALSAYIFWFYQKEFSNSLTESFFVFVLTQLYGYIVSFSRIYTGVHSFIDVFGGSVVGSGLGIIVAIAARPLGYWLMTSSLVIETSIIAMTFLLYIHPQPRGPCPCIKDSISFLGALVGCLVGNSRLKQIHTNEKPETISLGVAKFLIGTSLILAWKLLSKPLIFKCLQYLGCQQHSKHRFNMETITKSFIYIGIGWIACEAVPTIYYRLGIY